jgi:RNA-binding protein YhbY
MTSQFEMQLGKNGLTKELLEEIKKRFQRLEVKNMKISVLKSARESKADVKKYAEEIVSFLGNKFNYRVMGFSIFIKKFRREQKK